MRVVKQFKFTISIVIVISIIMAIPGFALALPTLQTYIYGATAGDYGPDEDTWWYTGTVPFTLYVVGAYDPNMVSLTGVTLLISVPQGETGTISFSTTDEIPTLLTQIGEGSASETNPTAVANISILTSVIGASGYSTINNPTFLPDGLNLNNHYPLKDDVSDFIIFDLFDFGNVESNLYDYNADNGGSITQTSQSGEQKEYQVTVSGFTWVHFDAYGLVTDQQGRRLVATWENNPGSHDATFAVPEPSTLLLLGPGLLAFILFRRKSSKS